MFNVKSEAVRTVTPRVVDDEEYLDGDYLEDEYLDTVNYMGRSESLDSVSSTIGSSGFEFPEVFDDFDPGIVGIVGIVSLIIAILTFVFLIQKKKAPRGRFMRWLREYLNFRSIVIAGIIKFLYAFLAVFLTIMSVVVMFQGKGDSVLTMIVAGLLIMIVGNVLLRIGMEMTMALIVVWENTSDIRGVIVKEEERPEEKLPKEPETPEAKKVEEVQVAEEQVAASEAQPEGVQSAETQPVAEGVAVEQRVEVAQPAVQSGTTQSSTPQTGA
ncbi:DUF4282 domain-containing protein [Candidatus Saccharibacteria bacterium]|nr:DUF4282 domain-containing protein [Candidatus Saccharibacteria bacterium]